MGETLDLLLSPAITLPVALLILAFLLRLLIDERASLSAVVLAVFSFPVDVAVTSLSFLASYGLITKRYFAATLLSFVGGTLITIIVIWLSKRSHNQFHRRDPWMPWVTAAISHTLALLTFWYAILFVVSGE